MFVAVRLFLFCLIGLLTTPAFADNGQKAKQEAKAIATTMREIQGRWETLGWGEYEWPACAQGKSAPQFPSDEFYLSDVEDPSTKVALVKSVNEAFLSTYGIFIKEETAKPEGKAAWLQEDPWWDEWDDVWYEGDWYPANHPEYLELSDFEGILESKSINESNCLAYLGKVRKFIERLKYIQVYPWIDETKRRLVSNNGYEVSFEVSKEKIISAWNDWDWKPEVGYGYSNYLHYEARF